MMSSWQGASGTQTVAATDGRSLTIAEWGDPGGFPVFLLRWYAWLALVGQADASAYASVGARVIAYDHSVTAAPIVRGRRWWTASLTSRDCTA